MVFKVASELEPESLGACVISQANTSSDVLAVIFLQKQFGIWPLFETLDDLTNFPEQLAALFSVNGYTGSIIRMQEVMVGYWDSAKDAGRLAA